MHFIYVYYQKNTVAIFLVSLLHLYCLLFLETENFRPSRVYFICDKLFDANFPTVFLD